MLHLKVISKGNIQGTFLFFSPTEPYSRNAQIFTGLFRRHLM